MAKSLLTFSAGLTIDVRSHLLSEIGPKTWCVRLSYNANVAAVATTSVKKLGAASLRNPTHPYYLLKIHT